LSHHIILFTLRILVKSYRNFLLYLLRALTNFTVSFFYICRGNPCQIVPYLSLYFAPGILFKLYLTFLLYLPRDHSKMKPYLSSVFTSVADPGCLSRIPDLNFFHPGSRIRTVSIPDPRSSSKNLSILTPKKSKKWFLSSKKYDPGCSSQIPDSGSGCWLSPIPDPGSRGQKGTQSRIPDPDPQHWYSLQKFLSNRVVPYLSTYMGWRAGTITLCCSWSYPSLMDLWIRLQFKTTFYPPAIMGCRLCLPLILVRYRHLICLVS